MKGLSWLRYGLFSARCAGAAAVSQALAEWMGLSFPIWATLSALVVSQERLAETRSSLTGRMLGTAVGMALSVVMHGIFAWVPTWRDSMQLELLVTVAVGAAIARRWPRARACMWTAVIVLVSPRDGATLPQVALWRGTEVALGGLCGAAAHALAERLLSWAERRTAAATL